MDLVETWSLAEDGGEAIEGAGLAEDSWWRVEVYRHVELRVTWTDGDYGEYEEGESEYSYSVQRKESGMWTKHYENPAIGWYRQYFEEWRDITDLVDGFGDLDSARAAATAELRRLVSGTLPQ